MTRIKLLGLALMAAFALSAVVSATAFGTIEILNKNHEKVESGLTISGNSVKETNFSILNGFAVTKCPEVLTEVILLSARLGDFHFHWHKCTTNLGGTCTGLGDNSGLILALGTFHLVMDKLTAEGSLGAGILFLLEHVHYTCEGGLIPGKPLILVLGEVLCLIEPLTLTTKVKVKCEKVTGKNGDPAETIYWTEGGTKVEMGLSSLLASENEGTSYAMSAQAGEGEGTSSEEVELMD